METPITRDTLFESAGSVGSGAPVATTTALAQRPPVPEPVVEPSNPPSVTMEPSALWKLAQVVGRILTSCLFDLKVRGLSNVPRQGGVLLVANHQSYLDPVLIGVRLRRPLSYVGKAELFSNRFFARFLRWLNAFPLRQGAGDVGAIKQTIARLQEGRALAVFPEGSRTPDGQMLPLQGGVGWIVRRARVPVVPVAIDGSFAAWPLFKPMFRRGRIRLVYGPPMDLSGLKPDEIVRQIEHTLRAMFEELKATDPRGIRR